jgi:ribA/ribD-fused uncharacterized protein
MDIAARRVGCLVRGDSMSIEEPDSTVAADPASAPAPIAEFQGEYRFLSNFWPAEVRFEGLIYPSSEHAYQAAKSLDPAERKRIAALPTPSAAKKAGAALKLRPNWDTEKFNVMETVVRDKFTRHADLRAKLLATGDSELIEGNNWGDRTWGVFEGKGENRLGKILMKIRAELRAAPASQPATSAPASQDAG